MAFSLRTLFRKEQPVTALHAKSGHDRDPATGSRPDAAVPAPITSIDASPFFTAPPSSLTATQPMNNASPFQPAAEEGFTIRELSILLPPQLLKSEGLPPDYLVPLPIESLHASFQAGRPCLRLSQVFQTAPYLFNRQLMPGEDQEVALPYQKVKRILEGAGLSASAPRMMNPEASAQAASVSPFLVASPEIAPDRGTPSPFAISASTESLRPMDSPFQTAPISPFQVASASPFQVPPQASPSPFQAVPPAASPFQVMPQDHGFPQAPVGNPVELPPMVSPFAVSQRLLQVEGPPAYPAPISASPFQVAQHPAPSAPAPLPPVMPAELMPPRPIVSPVSLPPVIAERVAPPIESLPAFVTLRLRSVLGSVPLAELGFDPVNVPDAVSVQLPMELVTSQLATGQVMVSLSDVTLGVAEKFRPAFSRAHPGLQISLPMPDLLQALPSGIVPPKSTPPNEAPPAFITPFQSRAQEDATRVPVPPAPVLLPPLLRPTPRDQAQEPSFTPISHLASHDDLGQPRDAESLNSAPPQHLPLRGAPPIADLDLPEISKPIGSLPPLVPAPAALPHLPQTPAPFAVAETETQDLQFGHQERPELLALRHLLNSAPGMSPDQMLQKVAALPGLSAALLISKQGQQNSGNAPAAFFDKAPQSHQSLQMLAESMSLPAEGCFTLRADQMVRTFFLDGSVCLAVLHSEPNFTPGIRDKLILVTREVAKLCA